MNYRELSKEQYNKLVNNGISFKKNVLDEGVELKMFSLEDIKNTDMKFSLNFPKWLYSDALLIGKEVEMRNGIRGTLQGLSTTFLDYYYIIKLCNGRIEYHSCVGGIRQVSYKIVERA